SRTISFVQIREICVKLSGMKPSAGSMVFAFAAVASVFQASPACGQTNAALTTIYTFSARVSSTNQDGAFPRAALVLGTDNAFYGTAFQGGAFGAGTAFRITPAGTFSTLAHFNGTNGRSPSAPLIQGTDGAFYGTTQSGGASNYGTIFRLTTN